ncbi:class I SAM-dependent methyltransferase [Devosia sediminis]|uniref:Class I SAM-dependent methyltransferase n=1 Tax=Devosia sediminis TaxID=2798801 RepID=A0A934MT48_9HYPH|nr:class I SAM-dependent methyltransferase [Devosia sediminis]MBJ3787099.1 class I SAM-dependent methyltransferase [Devosia sediminis]
MAQNIYDDPKFFAGYSQLPRQIHGLDGAPEWNAIKAMLPTLQGRRIADLGCGFGWASRWIRQNGATSVTGYDLSENMIRRARADTDDDAISYQIADLDTLELPAHSFELVYSALTFHYVEDFDRLVAMIHRALVPDGALVFTIEHPIFMAAPRPQWIDNGTDQKTWPVSGYSIEGERRTNWLADGVLKYHRTIGTTLNTLIGNGFQIDRVEEFAPTLDQIRDNPLLVEELERPMMLLIAAHRT